MRILRLAPALRLPPRFGWLDYGAPEDAPLGPGDIVRVPFRGRRVAALVLEGAATSNVPPARLTTLAETPVVARLDTVTLSSLRYAASRFHATVPALLTALLPAVPARATPAEVRPEALRSTFSGALLRHRGDAVVAYAARIQKTSRALQQTILAVPDILRAEELAEALRARDLSVSVCHHDLAAGARWKAWTSLAAGTADVLIATKAAVLAPAPRLGLVIIDAEDDPDHVQRDAAPYYDARLVLERRARDAGATLLFASETPRFATAWRAREEAWTVTAPVEKAPPMTLVPMRQESRALAAQALSGTFLDAARGAVQEGKNVIAFLNRAADARILRCEDCGALSRCATCGLALALHDGTLRCARCGTTADVPASCASCGGIRLSGRIPGVDAVVRALQKQLPGTRVVGLQRDRGLPDDSVPSIFVGTETLFKNARPLLDRPLGLVAALDADGPMRRPDYRAAEHAWAELERLANAARRHGCPFLVQTWEAPHAALQAVQRGSPATLAATELADRKRFGYPPFRTSFIAHPGAAANPERLLRTAFPDAELAPVGRDDRRRAVKGRAATTVRTALPDEAVAAALDTLPADWIIEPEREKYF
ncbi:hypothetical protein EPO33_01565 [Patescibacteria group bacterium]|nr:MAG: hypothetical protein EPO33_01565 [Patescibacteria group bacterium]